MEENLKMLNLRVFMMSKELNIHFQLLELPKKMGLLKRKIEPCKKWQEPFFMKTICQIIFGRVLIRSSLDKTPYELWKNKKPNISYFKVFGSKCFILNTKDKLENFDAKSNIGIFLGYSSSSKAYRVFNKKTMVVEESVHVVFDESNESLERRESVNDDIGLDFSMGRLQIDDKVHQQEEEIDSKKEESPFAHSPPPQLEQGESSQELPIELKFVTNHPQDQIICNPSIENLPSLCIVNLR